MKPHKTQGKVVMVSGANRGIGLAIARRLRAEGWLLSLGVRAPAALPEDLGGALVCRYEARDAATARAWLAATLEGLGRLDALVNNAGVLQPLGCDDQSDDGGLAEMLAVNCAAPFLLSRLTLPALRAAQGRIVHIVSISGTKATSPEEAGYCVSKFAAMGVSAVTHAAGRPLGVGVTAICPGWVDTRMGPPERAAGILQPEDVADAVAWVLGLPPRVDVPQIILNDTMA